MDIEEEFFIDRKEIKYKIDNDGIYIYRWDRNGVFEFIIFPSNTTIISFNREIHISSEVIKKERIYKTIKKPLDEYTYENVKNNLMYVNKTKEEKAKYIDELLERYLEWYLAKKLIKNMRWGFLKRKTKCIFRIPIL